MAAINFTPISLYYTTTASAVPSAGNLVSGELALNITDEKLYFKNAAGTVKLLASNAATTTGVTSFTAGTTGLTPNTATTGAVTLAGTLATANGGTNLTSFTSGGVVYASSSSALATGSALTFNGTTVGINTTIGNSTSLSITGDYTAANTATFIGVQRAGGAVAGAWGYNDLLGSIQFGTTTNHSLVFSQNNAEAMRLTSTGFGIGTTSPNGKLSLQGAFGTTATSGLTIQSTGSTTGLLAPIAFYLQSSNWGTVHQATITAQQVSGTDSGANLIFSTSTTGASTPTERARISAAGGFVVGTATDPGAGIIADANGNVRTVPQSGSSKTSSYTLATTDVGEYILLGASGAVVIPDAVFSAGDVVSIFNNTASTATITCTITTAYIAGTFTDKATMTLAAAGVATILFITGTTCVVSGNVT